MSWLTDLFGDWGLQLQIAARKREARKKGIPHMARMTLAYFGERRQHNLSSSITYNLRCNKSDGRCLSITSTTHDGRTGADDGSQDLYISFHWKAVYAESDGEMTCYIPGEWEKILERVFQKTLAIEADRVEKEEARKWREKVEREERDKPSKSSWGL